MTHDGRGRRGETPVEGKAESAHRTPDARANGATTEPTTEPAAERDDRPSRKERVLHTRVPAVLEEELKRFADNLRVPVSNLVRTILEDALDVAGAASETVEARLKGAAAQLEHERERLRQKVRIDPLRDVYAFQAVTLAQDARCAKCGIALPAGKKAHLGLADSTARAKGRVFVCNDCLPGREP